MSTSFQNLFLEHYKNCTLINCSVRRDDNYEWPCPLNWRSYSCWKIIPTICSELEKVCRRLQLPSLMTVDKKMNRSAKHKSLLLHVFNVFDIVLSDLSGDGRNNTISKVRYRDIRRSSGSPRPPCDGIPPASVWPSSRQTTGLPCSYPADRTIPCMKSRFRSLILHHVDLWTIFIHFRGLWERVEGTPCSLSGDCGIQDGPVCGFRD